MGNDKDLDQLLIEWAEAEGYHDFADFVKHVLDAHKAKTPVTIDRDGVKTEIVLSMAPWIDYKKPFPDVDIVMFYNKDDKKKSLAMFNWEYTYMYNVKKIDENMFHITSEESPEATIFFKIS